MFVFRGSESFQPYSRQEAMGNVQTAQSGDPAPSTSQVSHPQNPPKRPRLAVERELQQPLHIEVKKVKLFKRGGVLVVIIW